MIFIYIFFIDLLIYATLVARQNYYFLPIFHSHIYAMDDHDSFGILNGSCDKFTPEQFNNKFSSHGKKLFIMNFNIRSFNANFDQFSVFLNELSRLPDLIILTETWNSDYKNAEIFGFKSFHCNRPSDRV